MIERETGYNTDYDYPECVECDAEVEKKGDYCPKHSLCGRCHGDNTTGCNGDLCWQCDEEVTITRARDWHADIAYRSSIGD